MRAGGRALGGQCHVPPRKGTLHLVLIHAARPGPTPKFPRNTSTAAQAHACGPHLMWTRAARARCNNGAHGSGWAPCRRRSVANHAVSLLWSLAAAAGPAPRRRQGPLRGALQLAAVAAQHAPPCIPRPSGQTGPAANPPAATCEMCSLVGGRLERGGQAAADAVQHVRPRHPLRHQGPRPGRGARQSRPFTRPWIVGSAVSGTGPRPRRLRPRAHRPARQGRSAAQPRRVSRLRCARRPPKLHSDAPAGTGQARREIAPGQAKGVGMPLPRQRTSGALGTSWIEHDNGSCVVAGPAALAWHRAASSRRPTNSSIECARALLRWVAC
jgi:hypothetical protein